MLVHALFIKYIFIFLTFLIFIINLHIYLPLIRLQRQDEYFGKYFVTSFCARYYSKRISFSFLMIYNYFSLFFLCFRGWSYLHITNFYFFFLLSIKSMKDLEKLKLKAKKPKSCYSKFWSSFLYLTSTSSSQFFVFCNPERVVDFHKKSCKI